MEAVGGTRLVPKLAEISANFHTEFHKVHNWLESPQHKTQSLPMVHATLSPHSFRTRPIDHVPPPPWLSTIRPQSTPRHEWRQEMPRSSTAVCEAWASSRCKCPAARIWRAGAHRRRRGDIRLAWLVPPPVRRHPQSPLPLAGHGQRNTPAAVPLCADENPEADLGRPARALSVACSRRACPDGADQVGDHALPGRPGVRRLMRELDLLR